MSGIVLVDWLGRGGIAQITACWADRLARVGHSCAVVTRAGRELCDMTVNVTGVQGRGPKVAVHRAVATEAARLIRLRRPATVVVQNYVAPALEGPVYDAARDVGARLVLAVHDHRPLAAFAGTGWGLRRLVSRADVVVTYSDYVAGRLSDLTRQPIVVLPLCFPMATEVGEIRAPGRHGRSYSAVHFGVVKRPYKGMSMVAQLAEATVPGWRFTVAGAGAPDRLAGASTVPHFLEMGDLVRIVIEADAVILPYGRATQSGAVALAQALGTVPIASAVGGLTEQIVDGSTGYLLAPGVPARAWRQLLVDLAADPSMLARVGRQARKKAVEDLARFEDGVVELTA